MWSVLCAVMFLSSIQMQLSVGSTADYGFYQHGGICVFSNPRSEAYSEAEGICHALDMEMFRMDSAEMCDLFFETVNSTELTYNSTYWIGLYSKEWGTGKSPTWVWSAGNETLAGDAWTNWSNSTNGGTMYYGPGDKCVALDEKGEWIVKDCGQFSYFLCTRAPSAIHDNYPSCPCGYHQWSDSCYHVSETRARFEEANLICEAEDGHLVTINSYLENDMVQYFSSLTIPGDQWTSTYWIGFAQLTPTAQWGWVDASPVDWTMWDQAQPLVVATAGNCAGGAVGQSGLWEAYHCWQYFRFICEKAVIGNYYNSSNTSETSNEIQSTNPVTVNNVPTTTSSPVITTSSGEMDANTTVKDPIYEHHCLLFWPRGETYNEAEILCNTMGMQLFRIDSLEKYYFMMTDDMYTHNSTYWIGLYSKESGTEESPTWVWSVGNDTLAEDAWTNWSNSTNGGTMYYGPGDICVALAEEGEWIVKDCGQPSFFICSRDQTDIANNSYYYPSCPCGFLPLGDSCYNVSKITANFTHASSTCEKEGAHLVTMASILEFQSLSNFVNLTVPTDQIAETYWIGFAQLTPTEQWGWVDASPEDWVMWGQGQPSVNASEEGCAAVAVGDSGFWEAFNCRQMFNFICEISLAEPINEHFDNENHCLLFWPRRKTYNEAEILCNTIGMELFMIDSSEKYYLIVDDMYTHNSTYWIGLYSKAWRRNESPTWVWSAYNETLAGDAWTNWSNSTNGTMYYGRGDKCVALDEEGVWIVKDCRQFSFFICSRDQTDIVNDGVHYPSCPCGFHPLGDSCYRVSRIAANFTHASSTCEEEGGHLVTMASILEFESLSNFVNLTVPTDQTAETYWIGFAQLTPADQWEWVDASPEEWTMWGQGQPSVNATEKGCAAVAVGESGLWEAFNCSKIFNFICEISLADEESKVQNSTNSSTTASSGGNWKSQTSTPSGSPTTTSTIETTPRDNTYVVTTSTTTAATTVRTTSTAPATPTTTATIPTTPTTTSTVPTTPTTTATVPTTPTTTSTVPTTPTTTSTVPTTPTTTPVPSVQKVATTTSTVPTTHTTFTGQRTPTTSSTNIATTSSKGSTAPASTTDTTETTEKGYGFALTTETAEIRCGEVRNFSTTYNNGTGSTYYIPGSVVLYVCHGNLTFLDNTTSRIRTCNNQGEWIPYEIPMCREGFQGPKPRRSKRPENPKEAEGAPAIGSFGLLAVLSIVCTVVVSDVPTFYRQLRIMKRNILRTF